VKILLLIVSCITIVLTTLQAGKTDAMSSFTGGSRELRLFANTKERGQDKILSNVTYGFVALFLVLSIFVSRMS